MAPTSDAGDALLGKRAAVDPQLMALSQPLAAPTASLDLSVIAELFGNSDLSAAITALVNGMASGGTGVLLDWDNAVQLGADLVAALALAPAEGGVALDTGLIQALVAGLAELNGLTGPLGTSLLDGIATAAADLAAFLNADMTDLASAVGWKAQLDAVLADLMAAGGTDLTGGLSAALLSLVNGGPIALPEFDFASTTAALAAVINHVGLGIDTGLLDWADVVNLGADVVSAVALLPATVGGAVNAEFTADVLAGLDALAPIVGPLPTGIATAVGTVSGVVDTAITLPGQAVAWKAGLDGVLANLVAAGGAAVTNDVTADLMGTVGAVPVGLPDIGAAEVNASVTAVVDHVTIDLPGVFLGNQPAATGPVGSAGSEVAAALADNVPAADGAAAAVTSLQHETPVPPTAEKVLKPTQSARDGASDPSGETAHQARHAAKGG